MRNLQVLSAAAFVLQLTAAGEVVGRSGLRRTLFSSSGESSADIQNAVEAMGQGAEPVADAKSSSSSSIADAASSTIAASSTFSSIAVSSSSSSIAATTPSAAATMRPTPPSDGQPPGRPPAFSGGAFPPPPGFTGNGPPGLVGGGPPGLAGGGPPGLAGQGPPGLAGQGPPGLAGQGPPGLAGGGPPGLAPSARPSAAGVVLGATNSSSSMAAAATPTGMTQPPPVEGAAAGFPIPPPPPPPGYPPGFPPGLSLPEILNITFSNYLSYFFFGSIFVMLIYRLVRQGVRYMRTISSLNNPKQEYYIEPSEGFATLKKNIIHAPLLKYRRAQEARPHPKVHAGALPTRFQGIYLVIYLAINIAFSLLFIQFNQPLGVVAAQIKNRTGTLAVANLTPLVFIAGRHQPLCNLLHLSFDTFNTIHRWFGRMVVLLVTAHAVTYAISVVVKSGVQGLVPSILSPGREFALFGYIAFIASLLILVQASSPIRHAAYETFKMLHIVLVAVFLAGVYIHLKKKPLAQSAVQMVIIIWVVDRIIRVITLLKLNIGKKSTRATVEALPGDAVRVTLDVARPWKFLPGQHVYLYIPTIGYLQSHPFSVAWSSTTTDDIYPLEKVASTTNSLAPSLEKTVENTKFTLIIKARDGFTKRLVQKAQLSEGGKFDVFSMVEGPFGGKDSFTSYGTVMLFAGGVGITHMVPYVQQLVHLHSKRTIPTQRIVLVWVIPRPECLNWIAPWMQQILAIPGRRDCLRLLIYITRMERSEKMESPSSTIQILNGRPDVGMVMDWECQPVNQIGAVGVGVCGGGALADSVRAAVRERQMRTNIDFIEESFSW